MIGGMDDLELVKKRLRATPFSDLKPLGEKVGVSLGALFKIKYGTTKNPRFETVKVLADHYKSEAAA